MVRLRLLAPLAASWALLTACPETIQLGVQDAGQSGGDAASADAAASDGGSTLGDDAAMPGSDAGEPDAAMMGGDAGAADSGTLACIVDPFLECLDPDEATRTNDEWVDATYFNGNHTVGCLTSDNFTPLDFTVTSRVCPREPADWYQITLVGCDTRTMFGEIRVHPLTECSTADWHLEFNSEGPCEGGDGHTTCMWDGSDRVIRVRIDPRNTVFSWYFGIVADVANLKLDYAITVTLR